VNINHAVYPAYANGKANPIVCKNIGINGIGRIFPQKNKSILAYNNLNASASSV
jgi:hypothetical protein